MNIRLDYSQYGLEQLIGAIKTRAEKLGSTLHAEDALTRAKRAETESAARIQRQQLLEQNGVAAALQERDRLIQSLHERVAEFTKQVPRLGTQYGCDGSYICTLRTTAASINFYLIPGPPATKARIVLREWNVSFSVPPARQGIFLKNPEPLNERELYFDYQGSRGGWCWRNEDGGTFLTTPELADHILKLMIDLHDRVEKKRMSARDDPWAEEDDD